MGLRWRLAEYLDARGWRWDELATRLDFELGPAWQQPTPPEGLGLAELAELCEVLGCQPGELLTYAPESAADQAAANLANDQFYQSFLAHRQAQEDED